MQPSALPIGTVGQPYPATTFSQSGAILTYQNGQLPPELSFSGATLSGTPSQSGTFNITLSASNSGGCSDTREYSLVIRGASLTFTDDPLVAGSTLIKAVHITELRAAINALRTAASLGSVTFTDSSVTGLVVRAVHIEELRSALDQARAALGFAPIRYTNGLTAGSTLVRAIDVTELRNGIK